MQSIYDIKKRIKSVNSTVELTRAMYLISTSRIRRAMRLYQNNLLYFTHARQTIKHILSHMPDLPHEYLKHDHLSTKATCFIVIASNKGMAGGYNQDVCNAALEAIRATESDIVLITVGYMASEFFRREGIRVDYEYHDVMDNPTISGARRMMHSISGRIDDGSIDEAFVVYTHMENSVRQQVRTERLLPLLIQDFEDVVYEEAFQDTVISYEPDARQVITSLVPQYLLGMLYGMLVQSYASEHCKRMQAMDEATRNADELISELHLQYNGARQGAITQEIIEVVSGAMAIDGGAIQ